MKRDIPEVQKFIRLNIHFVKQHEISFLRISSSELTFTMSDLTQLSICTHVPTKERE